MAKQMKPYKLDELKATKNVVTEADVNQWREIIMLHVNNDATWKPLVKINWAKKSAVNRGFDTGDAAADSLKATTIQAMLTFIGTYSPTTTFKEITTRCKSLGEVWEIIRRWAGIVASFKFLSRRTFEEDGPNLRRT